MYHESDVVELKEKYTDTISKEIVAFLNTNGGDIYIGIKDSGDVVGVEIGKTLDDTQKKIADCIEGQIEPNPKNEITVSVVEVENKIVIKVSVGKGYKPIYCIKKYGFSPNGCFVRIGSTCRELSVDEIDLRYKNNFIDDDYILKAPSHYSPLSFEMLKVLLTSKGYHVNQTSFETNFDLIRKDGSYNLMAEILADKNITPLIFVKFKGLTKASISQRSDYGDQSIILGFQRLKDRLISENICVTNTTVRPRIDEYLYDIDCVNEALANAIVHNDWTISEPLVSFYEDRIEITSHGGLPKGITINDFYNGVSHPRNTVLMRIFLKLGIVEHTGHGIPKIIEKYGKDVFDIHDTYVNVVFPFNKLVLNEIGKNVGENLAEDGKNKLNNNEKEVISELIKKPDIGYDVLVDKLKVSRRTISRVFSSLTDKGYIERVGTNKTGYWKVIM